MGHLSALSPELFLTIAALGLLLADAVWPGRRKTSVAVAIGAVLAAAVLLFKCGGDGVVLGMMAADGMGRFFKLILLGGMALVLWMSLDYRAFRSSSADREETVSETAWGTYAALLLLATVGLLLLVSAVDFLLIVVALELIGVTSFILTGFLRHDRRSNEAAIKYFLVGAFSSALMIYGVSLLYGITGSTAIRAVLEADLGVASRFPLIAAVLFILVGFGFKLAMVPFHMWVPDAYEGAPTPITAFLSVAPKAAAAGILVRTFAAHGELGLSSLLAVLAAVTMTVGNLAALRQSNVKRLLAYSSIAQMGYVLVGFVAAGKLGILSVLVYSAAYLVMNLGAFACVIAVSNDAGMDDLMGFSGLSRRSLPLALATTVFMLSLTGIPPMVGFVGKFSVFAAAVAEGWVWLAVVGVINSVISLYYYFGIVHRMFFVDSERPLRISVAASLVGCISVTLLGTLAAGLFPGPLLEWVRRVVL
ncbi:MAG TPA: NADH-quinone oxidoreductase subunit N [Elusimicrobiota bacterium]|nr:NADH-quinone oxidoreductase subunit N [Elusimicrobiota bacterium]